ncbi:putative secreted protein [Propionispora sp. 2/2-37]|uniref:hypothetical protein n=1 Tax=Propionispora sp. 2/2-37 TaxID=1677858 RepID=UPI0006BB57AB|nr:hypothetical protein [Propionispora sp. 2/2-37]CUH96653.1 putative secreted protein [Propionispora sp. 2/2-37]
MKKKLSPARKRLLYALIGSSLFWHTTAIAYAEDTAETVDTTGRADTQAAVSTEAVTGQYDFTLEGIEVTANRDRASYFPVKGTPRLLKRLRVQKNNDLCFFLHLL